MTSVLSQKTGARRLLVIDDHPFFRKGVVEWINRQPDMECCGEADSVDSGRREVARLKPDLVLLDLGLRGGDGMELLKQLHAEDPGIRVLVISQHDEKMFAERVLRAGAMGYLMKEEATEEVLTAIRFVLQGEIHLSHRMASILLENTLRVARQPGSSAPIARLTDREIKVFELIGAGMANCDIAARMGISVKTVEAHREHIKNKLTLSTAAELKDAATRWVENGG